MAELRERHADRRLTYRPGPDAASTRPRTATTPHRCRAPPRPRSRRRARPPLAPRSVEPFDERAGHDHRLTVRRAHVSGAARRALRLIRSARGLLLRSDGSSSGSPSAPPASARRSRTVSRAAAGAHRQPRRDRHPHRQGRATRSASRPSACYPPVDERSLHTRVTTERRGARRRRRSGRRLPRRRGDRRGRASSTGCDCVHPGYGFLAENAGVRRALRRRRASRSSARRPEALALFGDKVAARALAAVARHPGRRRQRRRGRLGRRGAAAAADEIGYPVMLKAAAGGGGRGMRAVARAPTSWPRRSSAAAARRRRRSATARCSSSGSSPGPATSRCRSSPTRHGNVVHLYDRDCSVQLRNQKVVEIAPAPGLDPALRERILADADRARRRPPATSTPAPSSSSCRPRPASTSSSSATRASRSSTPSPSR